MEVASEYTQHPLTVIIVQCEHKTTLHFQNDTGYMQHTYFTLTPTDRKKLEGLFQVTRVIVVVVHLC
jgi:hypothetical protein